MELLDVLAKEMKEWPEGGHYVGQATNGTLHVNDKHGDVLYHTKESYSQPSVWRFYTDIGRFYTGVVTKEQWECAKVKSI